MTQQNRVVVFSVHLHIFYLFIFPPAVNRVITERGFTSVTRYRNVEVHCAVSCYFGAMAFEADYRFVYERGLNVNGSWNFGHMKII